MSDTDSFIEEVTEEVRRDRLFALLRRYGWIAGLAVLAIVGGAAWNEWQSAQATKQAQALGDGVIAALEAPEASTRADALASVDAATPGGQAIRAFLLPSNRPQAIPKPRLPRLRRSRLWTIFRKSTDRSRASRRWS